jgi:uncharacterized protein (DUF433 family)
MSNVKRIVSHKDVCGGIPTVENTRLSCADIARNVDGLGLERFLTIYPNLTLDDVARSLNYCASKVCEREAIAYCYSCTLRVEDVESSDVWRLSMRLIDELHVSTKLSDFE